MAVRSSISRGSLQPASGRICHLPSSRRQQLQDLRLPEHDLQLHPAQPLSDLPSKISSPLSRWLAREGHSCRHALWPCLRTSAGRLLPSTGCGRSAVSGMADLSEPEPALHEWRQLGSHARKRHSTPRSLLSGQSCPYPSATARSADQVHSTNLSK